MTNGYRALITVLAVTVVSMQADNAGAAKYRDAVELLRAGSLQSAHSQFLGLAEQGNAEAQFQLGLMAHLGRGIPQNFLAARKWYERAAKAGEVRSQNNLGVIYRDGLGVPADAVMAYKWFSLAASQGNVQAIASLRVLRQDLNQADILRGQQMAQQSHGEVKMSRAPAPLAPNAAKPGAVQAAAPATKPLAAKAPPQRTENGPSLLAALKAILAPARADKPKSVAPKGELAETKPVSVETKPEAVATKPEPVETAPVVAAVKLEAVEVKPVLVAARPEPVEAKPVIAAAKPEAVEAKPVIAAAKPEAAEIKPELAETKPEAVTEPVDRGRYLVQLGLFRDPHNVDRIQAKLKVRGIKVTARQISLGGRSYNRLHVGPYVHKAKAKAMAGLVNDVLGIRSLLLYNGTSKQAVATGRKKDHL